jgi:hypothetical protein
MDAIQIILDSLLVILNSYLAVNEDKKSNRLFYLVCTIIWSMCLTINIFNVL